MVTAARARLGLDEGMKGGSLIDLELDEGSLFSPVLGHPLAMQIEDTPC